MFAIACLALLGMMLPLATNGLAQDYVAAVFTFGHNATGTAAATIAPGQTRWLAAIDGLSATNAQGDIYKIIIPRNGTLKNLYWRAVSSGLTGSGHNIRVYKQTPPAAATPTSLDTTWNGTATFGSNTTSNVSVDAGDVISVRIVLASGGTGLLRPTVSFEYHVIGTPLGSQWTNSGSDIYYDGGNVGIGATTAIDEELTVAGTILADTIKFSSDGSFLTTKPTGGGGANSLAAADGNPSDAVFVDDAGNVGIGTTTPQEKLTKGPGSNSATEMFTPSGVSASVVTGGNLSNGWYYFRIVATDGVGTTVGSTEVSRQITASPNRRIALSWSAVQGATGYRIYKGSTSGGQDLYHVSPTNSFNYDSDAGADPGTVPTVTTAYVNKVSASGSSWVTGGNFGIGTTVPQEELTLASGSNSITEMAIPTGVTAAVISGGSLPVGTHYFRIVAFDGVGTTAGSAEVSGVVSSSTNDRIQLTWSPVLGAVKYRVYGGTTPGGESVYYETTNTTFDYDSHSNPGAVSGTVPPATTAYINKLSAAGNSWMLGGNVGIGTTNPQLRLHLSGAGTGTAGAGLSLENSGPNGRRWDILSTDNTFSQGAGKLLFWRPWADLYGGTMVLDSNGNVGIGTTNPSAALHINNPSVNWCSWTRPLIIGGDQSVAPAIQFGYGGTTTRWGIGHNYAGANFHFFTTNSDDVGQVDVKMTIKSDGNVGIGATSPGDKLQIDTPSGWGMRIRYTVDGQYLRMSTNQIQSYDGANAPQNLFLQANGGNVGIGTIAPISKLHVEGNVCASNVSCFSSRRWKTNIQTFEGALDKVQRLRGVSYDWKEDGKHHIGLIAEEVGKVIPEIVTYEENGEDARALDYSRLVAVLIEAVKEQQKQIDELKAIVKSLATGR